MDTNGYKVIYGRTVTGITSFLFRAFMRAGRIMKRTGLSVSLGRGRTREQLLLSKLDFSRMSLWFSAGSLRRAIYSLWVVVGKSVSRRAF